MMLGTGAPAGHPDGAGPLALLELREIEKSFGGIPTLRGANLFARKGEIVGISGEKGAGKSTLVKILAGVLPHRSYRGDVLLNGVVQRFERPSDALAAGIAVVH